MTSLIDRRQQAPRAARDRRSEPRQRERRHLRRAHDCTALARLVEQRGSAFALDELMHST
jgi:hypothetical protein